MGKLLIKNATTADIDTIRAISMGVWPQTYVPIVGAEQVDYMLNKFYAVAELKRQIEDPNHYFVICCNDQTPIAFAGWSQVTPAIYKLNKLYIFPGSQGLGVGRLIVNHIVSAIQDKNARELRLNVNRYNRSAIAFYEKTGFRHLYDEDIDIGNGYFMNDHVLGMDIGKAGA